MDDLQEKFHQQFPGTLFLTPDNPSDLEAYLRQQQWIGPDERIVSLEKPGEGNMNVVVRVVTDARTVIIKQARPWVQKYPQVDAPIQRSEVEAAFYQLIARHSELRSCTPDLIGYDAKNFILMLEDMGEGRDYTYIYQAESSLSAEEATALVSFLSDLHRIRGDRSAVEFPDNREMKELNHEHIFRFPLLEENGFNLDNVQTGLQALALTYKRQEALKQKVDRLGERYLLTGTTLLHGDYYPGSWLKATGELTVIDPEFAFLGDPEFDLGVMMAHLTMAQVHPQLIQELLDQYQQPASFSNSLRLAYSGVEILRRIIGLAQLPLSLSLSEKKLLLEQASEWISQYNEV